MEVFFLKSINVETRYIMIYLQFDYNLYIHIVDTYYVYKA